MEMYATGKGHDDLAQRLLIPKAESLAIGGSANSRIIRTTLKHSYQTSEPTFYVLGMTFLSRNEIPILEIEHEFEGRWTNPQNQIFKDQWNKMWTQKDTDQYVDLKLKSEWNSVNDRLDDLQYRIISMISDLHSRGHRVLVFQQADSLYQEQLLSSSKFDLFRSTPAIIGGYNWRAIAWQHEQGVRKTVYIPPNPSVPPDMIHPAAGAHDKLNTYLTEYICTHKILPPQHTKVNSNMKKLMVAGCSYSAVSNTHPDISWSEVLAKQLGWDLTNLARQGCSNGGIRVQIDEILRQRPDFAIITPTFWDRMEIPAAAAPFDWTRTRAQSGWNSDVQQHLQDRTIKNGYCREDGINNVNYGNNNYRMICETIFSLAENYTHEYRSGHISKEAQTAVRHYIDAIYDSEWKKQQDEWIIREGIFQLYHAGIDFLFVPVLLWPFDPTIGGLQWRNALPSVIPDQYVMFNEPESLLPISGTYPFEGEDPGFHSSAQGQVVIANNYYQRITHFK